MQVLRLQLQKNIIGEVQELSPNLSDYFLRQSVFDLPLHKGTNVETSMLNKVESFSLGELKFLSKT